MYHERMESFYVFGGISYTREVTNNLFVLHFPTRRWSKVPINNGRNMPYPRALHAAVATESYMVIYGGMANQGKLIYYESHLAYHVMVPHIPTLILSFLFYYRLEMEGRFVYLFLIGLFLWILGPFRKPQRES